MSSSSGSGGAGGGSRRLGRAQQSPEPSPSTPRANRYGLGRRSPGKGVHVSINGRPSMQRVTKASTRSDVTDTSLKAQQSRYQRTTRTTTPFR